MKWRVRACVVFGVLSTAFWSNGALAMGTVYPGAMAYPVIDENENGKFYDDDAITDYFRDEPRTDRGHKYSLGTSFRDILSDLKEEAFDLGEDLAQEMCIYLHEKPQFRIKKKFAVIYKGAYYFSKEWEPNLSKEGFSGCTVDNKCFLTNGYWSYKQCN